jgi:hypothetical protein
MDRIAISSTDVGLPGVALGVMTSSPPVIQAIQTDFSGSLAVNQDVDIDFLYSCLIEQPHPVDSIVDSGNPAPIPSAPSADVSIEAQGLMPTAIVGKSVSRVLQIGCPEGITLLAGMPHYKLDCAEAQQVSHLELRTTIAGIYEDSASYAVDDECDEGLGVGLTGAELGREDETQTKALFAGWRKELESVEQTIDDLVSRGYLRIVSDGGEGTIQSRLHQELQCAICADLPNVRKYRAVQHRVPQIVYEITDAGISLGRCLRRWDGQQPLPEGVVLLTQGMGVEIRHAVAAAAAGGNMMLNRLSAGVLNTCEFTRHTMGELSNLRDTIVNSPDYALDLAVGRIDEIMFGLDIACATQMSRGIDPQPVEIAGLPIIIKEARAIVDALRHHPAADTALLEVPVESIAQIERFYQSLIEH